VPLPAQHTFSTLIVLLLAAENAVVLSLILNSINNAHLELRIPRKQTTSPGCQAAIHHNKDLRVLIAERHGDQIED
jgi:hypothetical protein